MGFFDKFKKPEDEFDPLADLELSKLKIGFFLDYDLKTWEVKSYRRYQFDDGYESEEWELESGREKLFLEREEDDEVVWTLNKKIPLGALGSGIKQHIIDHDDPPEQLTYKETIYYLDESGPGLMFEGKSNTGKEFIVWDFIDEDDEKTLSIEQWGETEFDASAGFYVEEYQFTNILPGV
ncbi:MAG: DUF4178 domain-containing protein [Deferribacteres bacterium]|nr:DUF4178 domain-containing protein [candidate division KSB1 bacterium]MCB9501832.1 DUF4178 domain-containing protein [Deferribacteres bacterium]